jgi:hypothetical protein
MSCLVKKSTVPVTDGRTKTIKQNFKYPATTLQHFKKAVLGEDILMTEMLKLGVHMSPTINNEQWFRQRTTESKYVASAPCLCISFTHQVDEKQLRHLAHQYQVWYAGYDGKPGFLVLVGDRRIRMPEAWEFAYNFNNNMPPFVKCL